MSLSGNQITGLGATGFPNQAYLGFIAKAQTEIIQVITGVYSRINARGQSALSTITNIGKGVESTINPSHGIYSFIDSRGQSTESEIDDNGQGI